MVSFPWFIFSCGVAKVFAVQGKQEHTVVITSSGRGTELLRHDLGAHKKALQSDELLQRTKNEDHAYAQRSRRADWQKAVDIHLGEAQDHDYSRKHPDAHRLDLEESLKEDGNREKASSIHIKRSGTDQYVLVHDDLGQNPQAVAESDGAYHPRSSLIDLAIRVCTVNSPHSSYEYAVALLGVVVLLLPLFLAYASPPVPTTRPQQHNHMHTHDNTATSSTTTVTTATATSARPKQHGHKAAFPDEQEDPASLMATSQRYYDLPKLPFKHIPPPREADPKKGESAALVQHMAKVSAQKIDTSIDAEWEVYPPCCEDYYVLVTLAVGCGLKLVVVGPVLLLLLAPPVLMNYLYVRMQLQPLDVIPREGLGWKVHLASQWLLSLPAQVVVVANYLLDTLLMGIFGGLYCTASCGWGRYFQNKRYTAVYADGPSLYTHFADCVVAVAGSIFRQGFFEFLPAFTGMFLINPWIKYWLTGNSYVYELGERFITQIGQPMDDMGIVDIDTNFQKAISRAKHAAENRDEMDAIFFCPHYPYPPAGRQYAVGMQFGWVTTFTHSTHYRCPGDHVFSLSTSVELPVYRVVLWYNNPFHVYTGYVEASISNGLSTQPEKKLAAEHPMWLVCSHNWSSASRDFRIATGWIDTYFEYSIPLLQRFIRGNIRGWEVAEEYFKKDPKNS